MSRGCVSIAIFARAATDPVEDAIIADWAQPVDRTASFHLTRPAVARRFLLGRALIRALIERRSGENGRDCKILIDQDGKPFVMLASGKRGQEISLSHSGSIVVAAATELGPLGVDVEFHRQNRSFDAMASFAFGPRERQEARLTPAAFYRIWCLREAMSKATGRGLSEVVDGIDRTSGGLVDGAWAEQGDTDCWLLAHRQPVAGYSLGLAIKCPKRVSSVQWSEKSLDIWRPS